LHNSHGISYKMNISITTVIMLSVPKVVNLAVQRSTQNITGLRTCIKIRCFGTKQYAIRRNRDVCFSYLMKQPVSRQYASSLSTTAFVDQAG